MERWYSIVEYARKFNLSDMTVRRRIKNGKLQAVLKEGKYYIPISASQQSASSIQERQASIVEAESINESRTQQNSNPAYSIQASTRKDPSTQSSRIINSPSSFTETSEGSRLIKTPQQSLERPSSILRSSNQPSSDYRSAYQDPTKSRLYQSTDRQFKETSTFIANYDNLVQQFKRFEKILEDSYTSKINQLESELKIQKLENSNLKQQVEDLQVLIKLIEKRK